MITVIVDIIQYMPWNLNVDLIEITLLLSDFKLRFDEM